MNSSKRGITAKKNSRRPGSAIVSGPLLIHTVVKQWLNTELAVSEEAMEIWYLSEKW